MKIKKGDILKIYHCRKGIFYGEAIRDFDTKNEEFYPVKVKNKTVVGLTEIWEDGDNIPCRNVLCKKIEILDILEGGGK